MAACSGCGTEAGAARYCPNCGLSIGSRWEQSQPAQQAAPGPRWYARREVIGISVVVLVMIALAATGRTGGDANTPSATGGSSAPESVEPSASKPPIQSFTESNWEYLLSDPDRYRGATATFTGEVFQTPERDVEKRRVYLQVYAWPDGIRKNTIVVFDDPDLPVHEGDRVQVLGVVQGKLTGKNAFGAEISAPLVRAASVDVVR